MSTLVYKIKYRPLRIGWCVRDGDTASLIKAFRLSHCLWGGRFNPIIIADNESFARHLIELFHVDALFSVSDDEHCRSFSKSLKHLPWPSYGEDLFEEHGAKKESVLLDIYHPVRKFYEECVKDKPSPKENVILYKWNDSDPFIGVFEAMLGNYPIAGESDIDYRQFVSKYTASKEVEIKTDGFLDGAMLRAVTPNMLTAFELKPELGFGNYESGLFVGEVDSFSHLVEFWNLRAANVDLFFYDPRFRSRFCPMLEELEQSICSSPPHPKWGVEHLQLWLKTKLDDTELKSFKAPLGIREVTETTWDDRIWKGLKVDPPIMCFSENETVAQISDGDSGPIVTLQLPDKPGFNERPHRGQHLIATLKPTLNFFRDDRFLFTVPNIPELNEYFGRKHHISWNEARAEKEGLGIVTDLGTDHITLWGMERFSLAEKLFQTFGIAIKLSQPGLVCEQLIRQMGGLQGCRVFKIKGVRKLIEKFEPTQNFERSAAINLIRNADPTTGEWDFSAYENLHIERRDSNRLKPEDAFTYLLKQGVFRVGLKLKCTSCGLDFWKALDDVKAFVTCEYCGREFNTTPQLKDRNWAYRPSGLFGRDDNQEGGVPVALTLQQLETNLRGELMFWLPAINLEPITAPIEKCETDFFLLCQDHHGRVKLVISECKTNQEITDEDIRKLSKVADVFPSDRFDVFIVFSKAGTFSPNEIQRFKILDSKIKNRIILFSEEVLEPYFLYERAAEKFAMHGYSGSLEGMVRATHDIYFEPRLKNPVGSVKQ